jgi:hypothetical protein
MGVSVEADLGLLLMEMEKGLLVIEEIIEVSRIREACMDDCESMPLYE